MKTIPLSLNLAYYALLLLTFVAVVLVFKNPIAHSSSKRKYLPLTLLGALWVVLTVLALQGFFLETIKNTPPGFVPAVISANLFFVYLALFYKPIQTIHPDRMKWVVAIQTFRLPLELIFAWALALDLLPIQMTFEGRNFDVFVGLTAPFIAYFGYHKKVLPKWSLIVWNFAGLGLLVNIVVIALLSAPSNFQVFTTLPHNTIVLQAPYHFIPFFFVPLALFGHLFALKRLLQK